jgi:uncharacterized membrane protein YczE
MPRRLTQLYCGLVLYGFSAGLLIVSRLGNDPWDVLHQGLSRHTGIGTGVWADIAGVVVLLAWIPLRQRPGIGTLSNVLVVGLAIQATIVVCGSAHGTALPIALVVTGTALNAIATGMYIAVDLGPGPRDGLMTGIAARGHSIRAVRSSIELTALATGIVLGGTFGPATIFYALMIGPLVHLTLPWFRARRTDQVPHAASHLTPAVPHSAAARQRRPPMSPYVLDSIEDR